MAERSSGGIRILACNFAPKGTALVNGQAVSEDLNPTLAALPGTTFGGDGLTTVVVPDLAGRTTVGTGLGQALPNTSLGQELEQESVTLSQANLLLAQGGQAVPVDDQQPGLGLRYCIRIEGAYAGADVSFGPYSLCGIMQFSGDFVPAGFMACEG
jgi:microcystin-dependent protein